MKDIFLIWKREMLQIARGHTNKTKENSLVCLLLVFAICPSPLSCNLISTCDHRNIVLNL